MPIKNTSLQQIASIVEAQHKFFLTGKSRKYDFRREQLQKLQKALKQWTQPICQALWQDLHKSEQEAIITELSIVEGEIKNHLHNLKGWMRAQRRPTPLKMMPSRSRVVSEPLGTALIISPFFNVNLCDLLDLLTVVLYVSVSFSLS